MRDRGSCCCCRCCRSVSLSLEMRIMFSNAATEASLFSWPVFYMYMYMYMYMYVCAQARARLIKSTSRGSAARDSPAAVEFL